MKTSAGFFFGCVVAATSLFIQLPGALGQGFSIQKAEFMRRKACSIASPDYLGICQYTVVTYAEGKGLNIHFDLSELGDQGITWVVRDIQSESEKTVYLETALVVTRFPMPKIYELNGTCSVSPETFKCVTSDGRFQSHATGRL